MYSYATVHEIYNTCIHTLYERNIIACYADDGCMNSVVFTQQRESSKSI